MATVTANIGATGLVTQVHSATHQMVADEPVLLGGTATGFSPGELIASGLATCTCMTLRLYANRKGWPLESAEVTVHFERDAGAKHSAFTCSIRLAGPLDEQQRQHLLEIAHKCPLHLALTQPITISTQLV